MTSLYAGVPTATLASGLVGGVTALTLWQVTTDFAPWVWLAVLAVLLCVRLLVWQRFTRTPHALQDSRWIQYFTLATFGIGCAWGSANIFLFDHADLVQHLFLAFVSAGVVAGALSSLSFYMPAYFAFQLPILIPLIVQMALLDTPLGWGMATLVMFFLLYTSTSARQNHIVWRENSIAKNAAVHREQLLLRIEQMAHIGAWRESLELADFECTSQWRRIVGIAPSTPASLEVFIRSCVAPHDDAVRSALNACINAGQAIDLQVLMDGADGIRKSVHIVAEKQQIDDQWVLAGFLHDVSEQAAGDRAKSEFVSVISHELRTPLTAIIGALRFLEQTPSANLHAPENAELSAMALRNSERLLGLVNDLLDVNKFDSGNFGLDIHTHSLRAILSRAVEDNTPYALTHKISLHFPPPGIDVKVEVDDVRLLQVLANLISNAVKFSRPGQSVEISMLHQGIQVQVAVRDYGCGVPESFRPRMFTRFAQADSSDTRIRGGTGLGLAISKQIIEAMGGTLDYHSFEGEGSTFYFTLPLLKLRNSS